MEQREKELKLSMSDVLVSSDAFCTDVDSKPALASFIRAYREMLMKQFLKPCDRDFEITKTVWLDLIRWACAYRIATLRAARTHLWQIKELFVIPSLNPWCNLTHTFGGGCERCPVVLYNVVKWGKSTFLFGGEMALRCLIRNPKLLALQAAFLTENFKAFSTIVRREMEISEAVKIWNAYRTEPYVWVDDGE
jgi:hypothetical protein